MEVGLEDDRPELEVPGAVEPAALLEDDEEVEGGEGGPEEGVGGQHGGQADREQRLQAGRGFQNCLTDVSHVLGCLLRRLQ